MTRLADFGARLRLRRNALGLSVKDLARKLRLAATTIYNYEQGSRDPGYTGLVALAAALQCRPGELFPARAKRKREIR